MTCFSVKIRELTQLSEVYAIINLDSEDKGLDRVATTEDGQLLAISTASGAVHIYLTRLPVLGDSYRTKVAFLSSLSEVTVTNDAEQVRRIRIQSGIKTRAHFRRSRSHSRWKSNPRSWESDHCTWPSA